METANEPKETEGLDDLDEQTKASLEKENIKPKIKLDYTLHTFEDRCALVNQIVEQTPESQLTHRYLEILADYALGGLSKEERKKRLIMTDNRLITINKRETSFEGICGKLENGEDGIYNMMSDLGKNTILTPKDPITEEDIMRFPDLKILRDEIEKLEESYSKAVGKQKYIIKKALIEMRQNQYIIRNELRGCGFGSSGSSKASTGMAKSVAKTDFADKIHFDKDGNPVNDGVISFFNPKHIEALLCNYSALKECGYGDFEHDLYFLMESLDDLIDKALKEEYPLYYDIVTYKIDGKTNAEIQEILADVHGIKHSIEYISSLWRNKIPKLIAETASQEYLIWYYTEIEYGQWKKCSRCGEIKLAHNKFFSKNKSSKDGWYSLCKCCRNAGSKKNQKKQEAKQLFLDSLK